MNKPAIHFVTGNTMVAPYPRGMKIAMLGMGCFWGAEKQFWEKKGVFVTAVGYSGGFTSHPTYQDVCSGDTGHCEVVRVVFDPELVCYQEILTMFWEGHDPTQGMRQGNDIGTQYRSGIYTYDDVQMEQAITSLASYQEALSNAGYAKITTEILKAQEFYFAEEYHQQYLSKNPNGYCGLGGTGVNCSIGLVHR